MPIAPHFRLLPTFDRSIIRTNWSKINEGPLKRAGLLARKIERGLIRRDISKKQRPSKPGRPPKSRHPSDAFRLIYSVPHKLETNVIIGHVGFRPGQTAMEIHEFGQTVTIKERVPIAKQFTIQDPTHRAKVRKMFLQGRLKSRKRVKIVPRTIKMPERPFARPTLVRTAKRLPALWANSVGRSTVTGASVP